MASFPGLFPLPNSLTNVVNVHCEALYRPLLFIRGCHPRIYQVQEENLSFDKHEALMYITKYCTGEAVRWKAAQQITKWTANNFEYRDGRIIRAVTTVIRAYRHAVFVRNTSSKLSVDMDTARAMLNERNSASDTIQVPVELNVYDLLHPEKPEAISTLNWYLYGLGMGLYHSGVSIYGTEYCFGGHPDAYTGVFEVEPRDAPEAKFRETIIVGHTSLSPIDVAILVNQMSNHWLGNTYNLLTRNCNHFASELCEKLTGNPAPAWINRLAWMGEKAKFLLPEGIDNPMAAPVQASQVQAVHVRTSPATDVAARLTIEQQNSADPEDS